MDHRQPKLAPIIEAKDVSFSYDKTDILEDVHFTVESGEFVGIFGPNGGGKTTLLKLLMGFLEPGKGSFKILGGSPKEARKQMAYVPQIARFDKQFPIRVIDIVKMGLLGTSHWLKGLPKGSEEKAALALEKVGLLDKKDATFGLLSGGQAQRVLIARALVSDPEILLLDEPTASVDAQTEGMLYEVLMGLKKEKTILMVSHNLPAMIKRVDKCLLVSRKVTELKPQDLCEHYTVGLYHPPFMRS